MIRIRRASPGRYRLHARVELPAPVERVFPFFADAANLQQLTPPWLDFHILTEPPIAMHPGAVIEYQLRIHFVKVRWTTRILEWNPPRMFSDEQLRGPYRRWLHRHSFQPTPRGTLCTDKVDYTLRGGLLGDAVHLLTVRRDVMRIFEYRQRVLREIFGELPE